MPQGLLKSTKDSRNHVIWQPSDKSLRNVEVDEAGKLAAFRERFGRGWDLDSGSPAANAAAAEEEAATKAAAAVEESDKKTVKGQKEQEQEQKPTAAAAPAAAAQEEDGFDSLTDLISSYATHDNNTKGGRTAKEQEKIDRKK